jgi:hypothetical protein
MTLRLLFTIHAIITFAAGVVLAFAPALIPRTVGIIITPPGFLLCYLLAASELCIAVISWGARQLTDPKAIRAIVVGFIVLHCVSALLEIRAFTAGLSAAIWTNVAIRIVAIVLFSYYGIARRP